MFAEILDPGGDQGATAGISSIDRAAARLIIRWCARLCSCWNSRWEAAFVARGNAAAVAVFWAAPKRNEASARTLDAKLRKNGLWDVVSARACAMRRGVVPNCSACCGELKSSYAKLPEQQRSPSDWSRDIARFAGRFRLAGRAALSSSVEFQTIDAWRGVLSSSCFARSHRAGDELLAQVIRLAASDSRRTRVFKPEDEGAPVQVMGMLEAAGLRFDHLWIMGLHDEALPAAASPNPFLPYSLQRAI